MYPKLTLKKKHKSKFPLKLTQTCVKIQKMAKHLRRFRFTVNCVLVVSRGRFLFPVQMSLPLCPCCFGKLVMGSKFCIRNGMMKSDLLHERISVVLR